MWNRFAAALAAAALMLLGATAEAAPVVSHRSPTPAVGEVLVGDTVVLRLRSPLGNLSAPERTVVVAERLRQVDDRADIRPVGLGDGLIGVAAGSRLLVTVDEGTAAANGVCPWSLATVWASNLRQAYGYDPIELLAPVLESYLGGGVASWYGMEFEGRPTASGEPFRSRELTAAHRTLPMGTVVRVVRPDTGQSVLVRINDRGPFVCGRVIDLSRRAAEVLGIVGLGVAPVELWMRDG